MRVGIVLLSIGIGGTEKRLATLFQFLAKQAEHEYYLVAPDCLLRLLQKQGILSDAIRELHRIDCGAWQSRLERIRLTYYVGFPLWRRALKEALTRADAAARTDVFHYALPSSYFIAPRAFRRRSVIEAQDSTQSWHNELMLRTAARRGTVVNCLSEPIRDSLERRLSPDAARRLHLSPGSLLDSRFDVPPEPKQRRVVFVGRLEPVKSPLLFVNAIARLAMRTRDFRVSILGDGSLQEQVDARIRDLGLSDILDRTFHDRPREVLAKSMVFVSLQTMDNYPSQALLEAMTCRCATVASDVGSTHRLVTPETGLRVPLDADRIADAIHMLLSDPARVDKMGLAARALVQHDHSVDRYAEYLEGLYDRAAGGTG
jgi:glycosyltransferase involved in cell wall biosynthesis